MKNVWKLLVPTLFAGACSAPTENFDETLIEHEAAFDVGLAIEEEGVYEVPDEPIEKTIQELPVGYGSMTGLTDIRCFADPATWSGRCRVPIDKKIAFSNNVTAGTFLDVDIQEQAKQAINDMKNMGASLGWTLSIEAGKPDEIRLGEPPSSATALAQYTTTSFGSNDEAFGGGTVQKAHQCVIHVSPTRWVNTSGWSTFTTFQKRRFIRNAIKHEIGHCMGLGHHINSGSIMNATPIATYPNVVLLPIAADQTFLSQFTPN